MKVGASILTGSFYRYSFSIGVFFLLTFPLYGQDSSIKLVTGLPVSTPSEAAAPLTSPSNPNQQSSSCPVTVDAKTMSAQGLVKTMSKALARISEITILPENQKDPAWHTQKIEAFTVELKKAAAQLEALNKALEVYQHDAQKTQKESELNLFTTMSQTGSALAAFQVCYRYSGLVDDDIDNHFKKLVTSYQIFRKNYGVSLLAPKNEQENTLSESQKDVFSALKEKGENIATHFDSLPLTIKELPAITFEMNSMEHTFSLTNKSELSRESFLKTLAHAEIVVGRWEGLKSYVSHVYPNIARTLNSNLDKEVNAYRLILSKALKVTYINLPTTIFTQSASYPQDINVDDMNDKEAEATLDKTKSLPQTSPSPVASPVKIKKLTEDEQKKLDQQINEEDPDDETSLDLEEKPSA